MASINKKSAHPVTQEGGKASVISNELALRRSVMACMLWEKSFYESGEDIHDRIEKLSAACPPTFVANLALEARTKGRLRHVPLVLMRALARVPGAGSIVKRMLPKVIQRADELTEFLALYWKDGRQPLSAGVKKGLAIAFRKFDAYQLAKYNRAGAVTLRDVLFLSHAKAGGEEQAGVWGALVRGELPAPDTWEVSLSAGGDKKAEFERLVNTGKLGYMALLRNLRNMYEAGVSRELVDTALMLGAAKSKALPFRFIAAARAVPQWEPLIETAMMATLPALDKLTGKTLLLVDVSGSMDSKLSAKSDLKRDDAAGALAILIRGVCEDAVVYAFSTNLYTIPARHGMALAELLKAKNEGTQLGGAIRLLHDGRGEKYDRIIVITDEQTRDVVPDPLPGTKGYIINVACDKNGVGYGMWTKIDGFSESVVDYIRALETVPSLEK